MKTKIIEFKSSETEFKKKVVNRFLDEPKTPTDVFSEITTWKVRKIYYPMCLFEGSYDGEWNGQEGEEGERLVVRSDDRSYLQRTFVDPVLTGSSDAYRKQPDRLTSEKYTTWHRAGGALSGGFEFYLPIRDKEDNLSEVQSAIDKIPEDELQACYKRETDISGLPADIEVLSPNVDIDYLWEMRGRKKVDSFAEATLKNKLEGLLVRNLSFSISKTHYCTVVYLPLWVMDFEHGGKHWRLVMDEIRNIVDGDLPLSEDNKDSVEAKEMAEGQEQLVGCLIFFAICGGVGLGIYGFAKSVLPSIVFGIILIAVALALVACFTKLTKKTDTFKQKFKEQNQIKKQQAAALFGVNVVNLPKNQENVAKTADLPNCSKGVQDDCAPLSVPVETLNGAQAENAITYRTKVISAAARFEETSEITGFSDKTQLKKITFVGDQAEIEMRDDASLTLPAGSYKVSYNGGCGTHNIKIATKNGRKLLIRGCGAELNDDVWNDIVARLKKLATIEPPPLPSCVAPQSNTPVPFVLPKSRSTYVLLAILMGTLGVHNFYAGYTIRGIIQLLITLLSLGMLFFVSAIWAIVEACSTKQDANGVPFR